LKDANGFFGGGQQLGVVLAGLAFRGAGCDGAGSVSAARRHDVDSTRFRGTTSTH
jgi:hypothetical protein